MVDFYKILQDIMDEKGLSIPDVARACALSDSTIRSIIERKTKNVSLEVAFKMQHGLNVSLERLNGDSKIQEPAINTDSRLSEIDSIFKSLSADNQSKLTELALLFLDAQRKNEESQ